APGHVAGDGAGAIYVDRHAGGMAITDHIFKGSVVAAEIIDGHDADRRFQAVLARPDAAEVAQGHRHADGAVAAHVDHADVVEKNYPSGTRRIDRLAQERAHNHVRAAWLVHHCRANVIEAVAKEGPALGQRAGPQVRTAGYHHPRRLAAGVRVDHL